MKIRQGFVSNSSSTSFTAILTAETFAELLFSSAEKAFLKTTMSYHKLGDITLLFWEYISDEQGYSDIDNFSQLLIEEATRTKDSLLSEFIAEYNNPCSKPDRYGRQPKYNYSYFAEIFMEVANIVALKFKMYAQSNKCIYQEKQF